MAAAYTILVEFTVREGARPRFVELVRANAAASLAGEPGCRRFDVFVPDDGDRIVLYEEYRDRRAFADHCRAPHFLAFDNAVASMVVAKRVTELSAATTPAGTAPIQDASAPSASALPALDVAKENPERSVAAGELLALAVDIFARAGVPVDEAQIVANALVEADLRGMQSHGVLRIPIYVEKIRAGAFRAGCKGNVLCETAATVLLDGENGLGQVISLRAMGLAIQKARATGIGAVGVRNSNHFGEAAHYVIHAAERDMIGFVATNGSPNMPALGGTTKMTGPLPFTAAVPTASGPPFVIDAALGVTNRGKLIYLAERGERIPLGWGVDRDARPTDDPARVLDGGWILPIGGHKGFGITMFLEILSGVLTGSRIGSEIRDLYNAPRSEPQGLGHFLIAIDPAAFMPLEAFKSRMDEMIRMVKSSKLAPGVTRMIIPGEPEIEAKRRRSVEGIPLAATVLDQLNALAQTLGSSRAI
jgi:LDH2 family malate/lactate/ureidoglycolate dehydrogenase/quinol monooxygenase YgiN